jgi:hypothetical protein
MIDNVWSDDATSQLSATVQFRKLLSDGMVPHMSNAPFCGFYIFLTEAGKNATLIKIIRADVLPRFAEFLSRHALPQLQVCSSLSFAKKKYLLCPFSPFLCLHLYIVLPHVLPADGGSLGSYQHSRI